MSTSRDSLNFDQEDIRLFIGLTAILLPFIACVLALKFVPSSISVTYYSNNHDIFVGALVAIGAFLLCYKGNRWRQADVQKIGRFAGWLNNKGWSEDKISTLGGIAAWFTALFPTKPDAGCDESTFNNIAGWLKGVFPQVASWSQSNPCWTSNIHYIAAVILFLIVLYFCWFVFRVRVETKIKNADERKPKLQVEGGNGEIAKIVALQRIYKRRLRAYELCALGILAFMVWYGVAKFIIPSVAITNMTFWTEFFALLFFGIAWSTASKKVPYLSQKSERDKSKVGQTTASDA